MSTLVGGTGRPSLFQTREPRRRFSGPALLAIALHAGVVAWASRVVAVQPRPAAEPVKVVLRRPIRKLAVDEPVGGGPKRPPPAAHRERVRNRVRSPKAIPPPLLEVPPQIPEPPMLADADAEAGDADDEGELAEGPGGEGGSGTGGSLGNGPGRGSVASKARKAWLSHTDWRCQRPGYDEVGRVVVRIRVEVQPDGKPAQVSVVRPGPEPFNRRAVDCARGETYLPALDPDGQPIAGDCEFSIEFLN